MNRLIGKAVELAEKPTASLAVGRGAVAVLMVTLVLAFAAPLSRAQPAVDWDRAVVTIQSSRLHFNFYQPWYNAVRRIAKNGVAVEGKQILTTADWLQNSTLVRVQRGGRGKWWNARLEWIDYHANLAVVRVDDDAFWNGVVEVPVSTSVVAEGDVQIHRRAKGRLEHWSSTIRRVAVRSAQRSFVRYMMFEATSDIDSSGWSEVVTRGGEVVGLTSAQSKGDRLLIIPAPLIRNVMAAKATDPDSGLGYLDFSYQDTRNPANTEFLGLPGPPRGIIVTQVPSTSAFAGRLRHRDIILSIDGFPIDVEGEYEDPDYGFLAFDNLATRNRLAGDPLTFKVWRDGAEHSFSVPLPLARYENELVPEQVYDRPPQYLVSGGLVFQPLTTDYLRSWGKEWWKSAPFRLRYYLHQPPSLERAHMVILSRVLPDPINLGYQNLVYLAVDRINGQAIVDLPSVRQALQSPQGEFHVIEFMPNSRIQKLVLDAGELESANERILAKFGLPSLETIH